MSVTERVISRQCQMQDLDANKQAIDPIGDYNH